MPPWTFHLRTTRGSMTEAELTADAASHTGAHSSSPVEAELATTEQPHAGDEPPLDD